MEHPLSNDRVLIEKIKSMPEDLKTEALHYIDYLIQKFAKEKGEAKKWKGQRRVNRG